MDQQELAYRVWGVNSSDNIYYWDGNDWAHFQQGNLKQISVNHEFDVWGVNSSDEIYHWDGVNWAHMPGKLKQVSVGVDGAVWGVNAQNYIYRWDGSDWMNVPGRLMQISVGSDSVVWGVNDQQDIYRWNGNAFEPINKGRLELVEASTNSVWGINAQSKVFRWDGSDWQPMSGLLKQLSIGGLDVTGSSDNIWGVNDQDDIFIWKDNDWHPVTEMRKLSCISVGRNLTKQPLVPPNHDLYLHSDHIPPFWTDTAPYFEFYSFSPPAGYVITAYQVWETTKNDAGRGGAGWGANLTDGKVDVTLYATRQQVFQANTWVGVKVGYSLAPAWAAK